jgi:hypothetical protein
VFKSLVLFLDNLKGVEVQGNISCLEHYIAILLCFVVNAALVKLEVIDSRLSIIVVLVSFLNSNVFNRAS